MKKPVIYILLSIFTVLFATSYEAAAQGTSRSASAQTAEQSLQELVSEVRQLRAEVRRLGFTAYKTQVLVERLTRQQADVVRLSRDLSEVGERLMETRAKLQKVKESIKWTEKQTESGLRDGRELSELKAELEAAIQNEQWLIERESQLTSEVQEARSKLANLESQLNALEFEVTRK